jgi:hypothetical protein
MSIRTVTLVLLTGLFLVGLLLTPACARVSRWDVSYDPKIAGDGAGGAIALYDVMKNSNQRDFRVQRVSPEGQKLWGDQGVLVGSQSKGNSVFVYTGIISDSHSGAIVFRRDTGTDPKKHVYSLPGLTQRARYCGRNRPRPSNTSRATGRAGLSSPPSAAAA